MGGVIDHQPARLLEYQVKIWRWLADNVPAGSTPRLPPIVPIILQHDQAGWRAPLRFFDLYAGEATFLATLRPYLVDFEYVLDDLMITPDPVLEARSASPYMALGLEALKYRGSLKGRERAWAQKLARLSPTERLTVLTYLAEVGDADDTAALLAQAQMLEALMGTLADRWFQQGIEQGIEKGMEQGIEKGIEKGQRDTLRALLRLKFGAEAAATWDPRLAAASTEDLTRWTEKILTASTPEALFQ